MPHGAPSTDFPSESCLGRVGVAIVDDDEEDRLSAQRILEQTGEYSCIGSYSEGEAALVGIPRSDAKIVLMDICMPGMSGIECTRELKARLPRLRVVITTGSHDPGWIDVSQRAGADGYLTKPFSAAQWLALIRFSPWRRVGSRGFVERPSGSTPYTDPNSPSGALLDPRESAVVDLVASGFRNKEIAERLQVSVSVVEKLMKRIRLKLRASNRAEVAIRRSAGPPQGEPVCFR